MNDPASIGETIPDRIRRIRVIPTLLVSSSGGLVKTVRFKNRTYIGDPINAVRIFNEKGVDELVLLDIDASREGREPRYQAIEEIVSEAFMPVAYGGGITSVDQMARLFRCGLEKVILCTSPHSNPELIPEAAARFGSQSLVVSLDVRRQWFGGRKLRVKGGNVAVEKDPVAFARKAVADGAGEVLVYSIDRDGTYEGYDLELLRSISTAVTVPVIACGGARNIDDFRAAINEAGCSAVAAGSIFVYSGRNQGVLINYPSLDPRQLSPDAP